MTSALKLYAAIVCMFPMWSLNLSVEVNNFISGKWSLAVPSALMAKQIAAVNACPLRCWQNLKQRGTLAKWIKWGKNLEIVRMVVVVFSFDVITWTMLHRSDRLLRTACRCDIPAAVGGHPIRPLVAIRHVSYQFVFFFISKPQIIHFFIPAQVWPVGIRRNESARLLQYHSFTCLMFYRISSLQVQHLHWNHYAWIVFGELIHSVAHCIDESPSNVFASDRWSRPSEPLLMSCLTCLAVLCASEIQIGLIDFHWTDYYYESFYCGQ